MLLCCVVLCYVKQLFKLCQTIPQVVPSAVNFAVTLTKFQQTVLYLRQDPSHSWTFFFFPSRFEKNRRKLRMWFITILSSFFFHWWLLRSQCGFYWFFLLLVSALLVTARSSVVGATLQLSETPNIHAKEKEPKQSAPCKSDSMQVFHICTQLIDRGEGGDLGGRKSYLPTRPHCYKSTLGSLTRINSSHASGEDWFIAFGGLKCSL